VVRKARSLGVVSFVALTVLIVGAPSAVAAAPTITSFNPPSGPVGTSVTITGTGFQDASVVTGVEFNNVAAVFTVNSDVQITATVPAGATDGNIEVTDAEGTAVSATNFDVTPSPVPTITSFTPTSGPVGTTVVITGTGFTGASSVTFNNVSAAFIFNSDTQITATVPATATTGLIRVITPGGTATSSTNFTVQAAPTITSFSPTSGPVGTSVVIRGTGFTGVTSVTFNGVSAVFTLNSSTQITATVPATATTGPIRVTTPAGTATTTSNFTVTTGPEPIEKHRSNITLRLRGHLVATGQVNVPDGTGACERRRLVKIQRRNEGNWRTIGKDRTSANGSYKEGLPDREGKYRSVLSKSRLGNGDRCLGDVSRKRTYNHPTPTVSDGGSGDDGDGPTCDPSYPNVCIPPPPPDLDCGDVSATNFAVNPPDPHGFDGDNDGVGCET
jgi:IPT/TIG domain